MRVKAAAHAADCKPNCHLPACLQLAGGSIDYIHWQVRLGTTACGAAVFPSPAAAALLSPALQSCEWCDIRPLAAVALLHFSPSSCTASCLLSIACSAGVC